ncbi:MAG TPA: hypothetical protein VL401_00870 [Alphaproteobacteria bacterium]|jgi:hypothetical protein|nr:hypothetical protein [Alphaproteobacteria bacterium]
MDFLTPLKWLLIIPLFIGAFIDASLEDKIDYVDHKPFRIFNERGSVVTTTNIKNKGDVTFYYWTSDHSLAIPRIGNYKTTYDCFYVNSDGTKGKYMGTSSLYFANDSPYKKYFPLEIKDFGDLSDKYDDIVKIVKSFPKDPNPNYTIQIRTTWGKKGVCDLIQ